jgi:hypothetical protein
MNAKATENGPEILEEIGSTPLRGGLWENLKPLQKADKFFGPLIEYIETDVLPTDYNKAIKVAAAAPEFVMDNDLLFRIDSNREDTKMQLAVPEPLRNHAMIACHESLCTGHAGQQKTYSRVAQQYWWPSLWNSVRTWILMCEKCISRKGTSKQPHAFLRPIPAVRPFERVHVDILEISKSSATGYRYVITFVDAFSKYTIAAATRDETANTVARLFVSLIVLKFGSV